MNSKVSDWVDANQKKHVCGCGCGKYITIKKHHYYYGIPKFKHHHASKLTIKRVELVCDMCGNIFERMPHLVKKHNFCGNKCRNAWMSRKGNKNQNYKSKKYECEFCGKIVYRSPSLLNDHVFCSVNCFNIWRRDNMRGDKVHNFNSIEVLCDQCGNSILRTPSTIGAHVFCSRVCQFEWMSINLRGNTRYNYDGGPVASRRKRALKTKNRGYIPLNEWFDGCVGHHIDRDHIIHLPNELHNSTFLQHNYYTWANMDGQNKIAFDYLYDNLDDVVMNLEAIENLRMIYTVD